MQTPSASDPSFKAFLEKLQEQNNRGFASQLVQLKAERENAGEDNDKREKQLDDVIASLKEVRNAVTGTKIDIDLTPLVNIGENQTKLLEELNMEASLTRKLTEGSVEYDKEATQYRNTSGRDIESKVSGKTSKDGGFIDFETARDTLSGQGNRVREDNSFSLKPINYTPGKAAAAAVGGKGKKQADKEEGLDQPTFKGLFEEIKSGFKFFMTDGLSEKPGTGIFQTPSKEVEKKDREAKVSSPRQENPEADNINTTGEIQADVAKSDLEISKQMLETTKAQLVELKAIREALAPSTPRELIEQKSAPSSTNEKEQNTADSSTTIPDIDLPGRRRPARRAPRTGIPKPSKLGLGLKIGGALAIGAGAYTAYTGVEEAEDSKQAKMEEVQAKVDSGEIKPEEAAAARKEIGNTATIEKSGAVGEGTGIAAGGIAGSLAGAKLGATVGLAFGGVGAVPGALVGGLAGGALGAFAGSSAGKYVGEKVGSGINTVKNFFGGEKKKPEIVSPSTATITNTTSESKTKIAGEDVGEKLSDKQMTAIEMSKSMGNSYSPEIEAMYTNQSMKDNVTPAKAAPVGVDVSKTSAENADMGRETGKGGANNTVVSNNVSSNNTTKIVPMKANPRPEYTGSSLDRYTNRITVY
jgi:hypothetical protein